ncbi:hypothetical protein H7I41_13930 [Mycobacterium manitobense]|uniref:Uncharacterized protein n=1 Tax=[Mycobacterium] manitobense TaxID=190147 RepID=A0A9X2YN57_9MYCO|nr:hypothetical protein [[Mycobacterium] manitobense]MCV7171013.1 hypothetical protein [[Mycobacterium] manitobense]
MSYETEAAKRPSLDWSPGSPLMLIGFGLGVLAASTNVFVYFWPYAWLAPLTLSGLCALLSLLPRCRRLLPIAEGAFAAVVFAAVLVCVIYAGLAAAVA